MMLMPWRGGGFHSRLDVVDSIDLLGGDFAPGVKGGNEGATLLSEGDGILGGFLVDVVTHYAVNCGASGVEHSLVGVEVYDRLRHAYAPEGGTIVGALPELQDPHIVDRLEVEAGE